MTRTGPPLVCTTPTPISCLATAIRIQMWFSLVKHPELMRIEIADPSLAIRDNYLIGLYVLRPSDAIRVTSLIF